MSGAGFDTDSESRNLSLREETLLDVATADVSERAARARDRSSRSKRAGRSRTRPAIWACRRKRCESGAPSGDRQWSPPGADERGAGVRRFVRRAEPRRANEIVKPASLSLARSCEPLARRCAARPRSGRADLRNLGPYHRRATRACSLRAMEDERLLARIRELHAAGYVAYRYRRMRMALGGLGERVPRCGCSGYARQRDWGARRGVPRTPTRRPSAHGNWRSAMSFAQQVRTDVLRDPHRRGRALHEHRRHQVLPARPPRAAGFGR
jgi:hypothetical protein